MTENIAEYFYRTISLVFLLVGLVTAVLFYSLLDDSTIAAGAMVFAIINGALYLTHCKSGSFFRILVNGQQLLTLLTVVFVAIQLDESSAIMAMSFYLVPMVSFLCLSFQSAAIWTLLSLCSLIFIKYYSQNFNVGEAVLMGTNLITFYSLLGFFRRKVYAMQKRELETLNKDFERSARLTEIQHDLEKSHNLATVGSLAAGIAHDAKSPLAAIAGAIGLLQKQNKLEESEMTTAIFKAVGRLDTVISSLQDIASNRRQLESVIISKAGEEAVSLTNYRSRVQHVEVKIQIDSKIVLLARYSDLVSIFSNLILNSLDSFAEKKNFKFKEINISAEATENRVVIHYEDNANGIDSALADKIFERSFSTKPRKKGAGLGMFITKTSIESLGGSISFQSKPGIGSKFEIRFDLQTPTELAPLQAG